MTLLVHIEGVNFEATVWDVNDPQLSEEVRSPCSKLRRFWKAGLI